MNYYDEGYLIREARRDNRVYHGERRGRKAKIDGDRAVRNFIELKARAIILSGGLLTKLLDHPRLRIPIVETKIEPGAARRRLNREDRAMLRKRYAIGRVEVEFWEAFRCYYGPPQAGRHPDDRGEHHPVYLDIMTNLEARVAELRSDEGSLFFLTGM